MPRTPHKTLLKQFLNTAEILNQQCLITLGLAFTALRVQILLWPQTYSVSK